MSKYLELGECLRPAVVLEVCPVADVGLQLALRIFVLLLLFLSIWAGEVKDNWVRNAMNFQVKLVSRRGSRGWAGLVKRWFGSVSVSVPCLCRLSFSRWLDLTLWPHLFSRSPSPRRQTHRHRYYSLHVPPRELSSAKQYARRRIIIIRMSYCNVHVQYVNVHVREHANMIFAYGSNLWNTKNIAVILQDLLLLLLHYALSLLVGHFHHCRAFFRRGRCGWHRSWDWGWNRFAWRDRLWEYWNMSFICKCHLIVFKKKTIKNLSRIKNLFFRLLLGLLLRL